MGLLVIAVRAEAWPQSLKQNVERRAFACKVIKLTARYEGQAPRDPFNEQALAATNGSDER